MNDPGSTLDTPDIAEARRSHLLQRITSIGKSIAEPAADDVDRNSRFPIEAVSALREAGALSAAVPVEFGGHGCSVSELSAHCEQLGQRCSSSAMILAMHHVQVACIARHVGSSEYMQTYLRELAKHQYLVASVTSEVGIGGDLRSSTACVETAGTGISISKSASTISYGAYADDFLVTARRNAESAPGDQVLILIRRRDANVNQVGSWDTLGMRGTCSPGFELQATGSADQIIPSSFAEIVTRTMVPYSHLLWCSVWTGIARGGLAKAGTFVRSQARKQPGTVPPTALRLAEASNAFQSVYQQLRMLCQLYETASALPDASDQLSSFGFALQMNNLKISTSQQVAQIVRHCLDICGIAGYKNDSPFALGRPLRDALSASLMIGNDRMLASNASMLLMHKEN